MEEQRELVFHDTVPLPDKEIPMAREIAIKQKTEILGIFKRHPEDKFTPYDIHNLYECFNGSILITSVRRSITDLTKGRRLIKCQWSDGKMGKFGRRNRTWRYNTDYLPNINRK